jgi:hypothetical protein
MQNTNLRKILIISILLFCLYFVQFKKNQQDSMLNNIEKINISSLLSTPKIKLKIVMPFHLTQLEILLENIKKWEIFKLCYFENDKSIELIFYIGYFKSNLTSLNYLPKKIKCFSKISTVLYKYKSLNEDKHVVGSRLMFESMLLKTNDYFKNAWFIFYMEPDARPIKSNWLDAISNEIGNGNFWCKGSVFRGDLSTFETNSNIFSKLFENTYIPNYLHINGNAIYNIGDSEFILFYFNLLRPYIVKKNGFSLTAYDTDFFEYLIDKNNYETTRNIFHKFHFTDLIQNYWHTEFKINEVALKYKYTYFVHGGKPVY